MSFRRSFPLFVVAVALSLSLPSVSAQELPGATATPTIAESICPAVTEEAPLFLILPPPIDFLLCNCRNCTAHPYETCQISPDGYSIECSDYLRINCDK